MPMEQGQILSFQHYTLYLTKLVKNPGGWFNQVTTTMHFTDNLSMMEEVRKHLETDEYESVRWQKVETITSELHKKH